VKLRHYSIIHERLRHLYQSSRIPLADIAKMSSMMPTKANYASKCRRFLALSLIASSVGFTSFPAVAGEILTRVQSRRLLNCGVSEGRVGFSYQDAKGRWLGLDADFCRAVATAVIGDAERVKFISLLTAARFVALRSNEIDVLSRNTTWTIGREAGLGIHFVGTLFYDGQGFMVPGKGRARKIADLKGASICVMESTTTEENLTDYFGARGWKYQAVLSKSIQEASQKYFAGHCAAYTADRSNLAAVRLSAPGGSQGYVILPEQISKEPLGPAIKRGDEEWLVLLKWIYFVTIEAEELGVTSKNIRAKAQTKTDPRLAKFLDASGTFAKSFGVQPGWVLRILESVGNYGEMFERNLGQGSALKLDRGPNRLWTEGGLMYAPPFL
jgi:general L-amino acid transport system substrate-binding protein